MVFSQVHWADLQVMQNWICNVPEDFQDWDFNHKSQEAILEGLDLVMKNNLMQFGDTYFL